MEKWSQVAPVVERRRCGKCHPDPTSGKSLLSHSEGCGQQTASSYHLLHSLPQLKGMALAEVSLPQGKLHPVTKQGRCIKAWPFWSNWVNLTNASLRNFSSRMAKSLSNFHQSLTCSPSLFWISPLLSMDFDS